jgi:DNA-binding transcriptional LysR family regulator
MDTKQLAIFLSVAQSLSFTKAAQEHYMTQPAISHQITELEKELGAKLFLRNSHNVTLTSAGQVFLPRAQDLLERMYRSKTRVYEAANGIQGHLKILTVQGSLRVTTKIISLFAQRYPKIRVDADIVTGAEQMRSINTGDADLIISFSTLLNSYPQLEYRTLERHPFYLLLPPGYELPKTTDDLSGLREYSLLCERDSEAPFLVSRVLDLCRRRKLNPEDIHWCNSGVSQLLSVRCGLGFAITAAPDAGAFTEQLHAVPIEGDDAMADDSIGWFKNSGNQALPYFLGVVRELYPEGFRE